MVSALVRLCVVVVVFIGCITQTCARWPTQAANPGFKARITKNGLKFINDVGVGMLAKDVPGETIPDISGTADISIGKVDYTVSSMSIRSFNVPVTSLTTQQGVGLSFKASGGAISLHGDWRYKYKKGFIHISDHGNFDATVNGLNINLDIGLGKDSTGHPSITSTHCSGSISSISITFHGGASWLYNLFSSSIENTLKKSLNGKICDIITKEIEDHAKPSLANLKREY
ncbi:bactericidal permeability-increasing protein-like [Saccoglossus kowalevskii]|uniref:Lipopolysaccharide-binding protein-like n=1 Tax=Saccoglossus kowalevskii TaxID=10224 RepID=A0ABM0LWL1_SACKO|nr:PREDICTED: lipopolysaccharide-binding protein-like [Saccoglossus kowalevskii]